MFAVATEEKVAGDALANERNRSDSECLECQAISASSSQLAIRPSDGRRADKHPSAKGTPAAARNWESHVWGRHVPGRQPSRVKLSGGTMQEQPKRQTCSCCGIALIFLATN
ncbi:hypothetical protein ABW21_db0204157 [Orbilia brochopaga]|nr:hypothetical protein ABW21_db0204157 [Drechslerella brochopaga]